jgi:outer membrane receptor for ferrienterochelin and colicins
MKGFLYSIISFSFVFIGSITNGQVVSISTSDKITGEALPFVHICTQEFPDGEKIYSTTGKNGKVDIKITQPVIVNITTMGYEIVVDTIYPGISEKQYKLNPSNNDIDEVVVTGQHKITSVDQSIYDIKLIGSKEIESRAVNNLADLLSNELNIRLNHDPSTGTAMQLQGLSGENVKILIDGIPVIGRLNGNIDLSQINLDNVDHIEIIEGPMSVIYGSNALAGVVNIITKQNKYADFKFDLHSYYETIGIYNVNTTLSFKKNKHAFDLAGGRNFFDGFSRNDSSRRMDYKPKEQYNVGLSYNYSGKRTNIRYNSDFFKETLLDRGEAYPAPYYDKGYDIWNYTHRLNNSLNLRQELSPKSNIDFLAAYSYYAREKLKYIKDLTTLISTLSTKADDHDTSVFNSILVRGIYNNSFFNSKLSLQSGIELNHETGTGKRIKNTKEDIGDYAAYASLQMNPIKWFTFQPGLRYAYNTKYKAPLVPSVNLQFQLLKTNFRLSYSRGFRAPSLKELYLLFYDSNHQIEGNDSLKAEYSHSFNFSVKTKLQNNKHTFHPGIKAYYNIIENMIVLVAVDPENPLWYRNENIGHFESMGFEAFLNYQFNPGIFFEIALSKAGRKEEIYENNTFVYSTNLNSTLGLNFWKNTAKVTLIYKFTGSYPIYMPDENGQIVPVYMNNYHSGDMTFSKNFLKNRITVSCGVKNLFNNTGIGIVDGGHGSSNSTSSLVGWGRTYFLDLKFKISKY